MKALHPTIVQTFLGRIPGATAITGVEHGKPGSFVLVVDVNGEEKRLEVPKVLLAGHIHTGVIALKVPVGATVTQVLETLSKQYGLYWVEGVDYVADDSVAEETLYLEIPSSSFLWEGLLTVNLHPQEARDSTPIQVPLATSKTALLLIKKIFKGEGNFLTAKGNLTQKAAESIIEYLLDAGDATYVMKDLSGCKVIKVFADTFSSIAVLDVKDKGNVFIRFDYEKDNVPEPTPR